MFTRIITSSTRGPIKMLVSSQCLGPVNSCRGNAPIQQGSRIPLGDRENPAKRRDASDQLL